MTDNPHLAFAHRLADAARAAILPFFRMDPRVSGKASDGVFNPVTEADLAAEAAMRTLIEAERPDDAIHGEEFEDRPGTSGWTWVLDPIDGTSAFMAGTSTWGVLIGALRQGVPAVGVMDQPFTGERWAGSTLEGAREAVWTRGVERTALAARHGVSLSQAMIATTDPAMFARDPASAAAFAAVREHSRLVRYGLDCTAYALVAHGCIDLVIESGLKAVDIAALIPVIEASGGAVCDWQGRPNPLGGQVVAAGSRALLEEVLSLLAPAER